VNAARARWAAAGVGYLFPDRQAKVVADARWGAEKPHQSHIKAPTKLRQSPDNATSMRHQSAIKAC
jgi:hypothetical protein